MHPVFALTRLFRLSVMRHEPSSAPCRSGGRSQRQHSRDREIQRRRVPIAVTTGVNSWR